MSRRALFLFPVLLTVGFVTGGCKDARTRASVKVFVDRYGFVTQFRASLAIQAAEISVTESALGNAAIQVLASSLYAPDRARRFETTEITSDISGRHEFLWTVRSRETFPLPEPPDAGNPTNVAPGYYGVVRKAPAFPPPGPSAPPESATNSTILFFMRFPKIDRSLTSQSKIDVEVTIGFPGGRAVESSLGVFENDARGATLSYKATTNDWNTGRVARVKVLY